MKKVVNYQLILLIKKNLFNIFFFKFLESLNIKNLERVGGGLGWSLADHFLEYLSAWICIFSNEMGGTALTQMFGKLLSIYVYGLEESHSHRWLKI